MKCIKNALPIQWHEHEKTTLNLNKQEIVGNLKQGLLLTSSSWLYLVALSKKESAAYLKAKMTTLVKLGEVCMQRISHVTSKSKEYMLQTIWMVWKSTPSNQSEPILYSETSSYFDLKSPMIFDGTSDIQCLYDNGRLVTRSQHEYDLEKRICLELRVVHTPTLNCEDCMIMSGILYGTWQGLKN